MVVVALADGPAVLAAMRPARLVVHPASLELTGADPEHRLIASAEWSDGRREDVTGLARFVSTQPQTVTVSTGGVCRAAGDGTAEIAVEYLGRKARVPVAITHSAMHPVPSFRQDVEPVLTRAGCNMGACHGKLAGQNGFKLSLRGYAPELDHGWLTTDLSGRRINPACPEESLLLLKPLGQAPHEGRQRFAEGSRYHRTLADWIAARAPGPDTNETDAVRLELLPGHRTLRLGETQPLLARAHYADGRVRDVTWLAQFFSNDGNIATVTPEGAVTARRHGETAIRVHFQGQVEALTMAIPYENRIEPRDFARKNNLVDEHVFAKLKVLRISPSPECDDAAFLRRASLDLTGSLPARQQVRAFLEGAGRDKRARLVEQLLASEEFIDYWTLQLADLLQNRRERDHDVRGTKGVRAFHTWLRAQVAANRPWNDLARELLTASGDTVARPEVGYFIYTIGEKRPEESELTDSVAQSFLGTRIGCARCHNHPLEKYTQDDYYHFAAFFSKVSLKREPPEKGASVLFTATKDEQEKRKRMDEMTKAVNVAEAAAAQAAGDEAGKAKQKLSEQHKKLDEARKEYERAMARMPGVTHPRTKKFMAPQALDRSPFLLQPGGDVRAQLADWMTNPKNPQFSGAMVNRLWKHFMGAGLVEPVDDLRASNPPSNPALWQALNRQFVSGGYDLKRLMRLIVNSRAYQLGSATRPGNEADTRFHSHYYARRLPAEVLLDALSTATGVPDEFKGYPLGTRAVQLPEPGVSSYFLSLFGRSDRVTACACERQGEVTLPQLLHLQNGDATLKKIRDDSAWLPSLLKQAADDASAIEELFLATVSRPARPAELAAVKRALGGGDEREAAFQDLFWALLNSKEFAFNH